MKTNYFKWTIRFVTAVLLSTVLFSGCKKEEDKENATAPTIPPKSTMVMDVMDTTATGKVGDLFGKTGATYVNFLHAAGNIWVWNAIIVIHLAIPVAAFTESFNHEAVYQSDGSWKWAYSVNHFGNYDAELYGKISGGNVNWEMYIAKTSGAGQFSKFKWFTGTCDLALTHGTWSLNKDPNNATPYVDIEWNRDATKGTSDIKYTNVIPGDKGNGGYLQYGIVNSSTFDAFYDIFYIEKNNLTEIEWNRTKYNGQVKDEDKFNDKNWHCWDTTYVDITCPQ